MRSLAVAAIAIALVFAASATARADTVAAPGAPAPTWAPEVNLRVAYARPFGNLEGEASTGGLADPALSDHVVSALPLTLGFGARHQNHLYVGLAGSLLYVSGQTRSCGGLMPCTQNTVSPRAALEAQYRFDAGLPFQPWLGAGAGAEWLKVEDTSYRGLPFLSADAGAVVFSRPRADVGLFLGVSLSRSVHAYYSGAQAYVMPPGQPPPRGRTIDDRAWHGWLEAGIRGAFTL